MEIGCIILVNLSLFSYISYFFLNHLFSEENLTLLLDLSFARMSGLGLIYRGDPEDALHLGSNGIRILVKLIRDQIYSSTVSSNKTYKAALTGPNASGGGMDCDVTRPHQLGSVIS